MSCFASGASLVDYIIGSNAEHIESGMETSATRQASLALGLRGWYTGRHALVTIVVIIL